MNMNSSNRLNAVDLLPEFQRLAALVDGERYVLAEQPVQDDGGALRVTSIIPTYFADADSWRFSDGRFVKRRENDLWIKESEYPAALERSNERMQLRVAAELKA